MYIRVESYVDHHGAKMPHRLQFDSHHVNVVDTLDQWYGPDYRYVKFMGNDGCLYIFRYDAVRDDWELTMFESVRAQAFLSQIHGRKEREAGTLGAHIGSGARGAAVS